MWAGIAGRLTSRPEEIYSLLGRAEGTHWRQPFAFHLTERRVRVAAVLHTTWPRSLSG